MCGILGTTKNISKESFEKILSEISHRGPDDVGVVENNGVFLGHRRLSIIDLSNSGHQPMLSDDGSISLVFNGEIYNFIELKKELESSGVIFKSKSDTEVILKGFEKYGEKFLNKMRGMWAVAVYDLNKNTITLSCDHFGIKPLYYSEDSDGIVFGSETKSIIPVLSKITANTSNYFLYYNFGYFPGEMTCFNEIKKVLPGQIISFNLSLKTTAKMFIDLPTSGISIKDEDGAIKNVIDGMTDSVKKHFISDVPVGILLSGGNDSSFLVAISKKNGERPICFNVDIEGSLDNKYAESVAKYLDLPFEKISINENEFEKQYKKIWDILDQPTSDVSFIPTSLVYSSIRGKSKVVLSGEGGDELFGGYLRHLDFSRFDGMSFNSFFPDLGYLSKFSIGFLNPIINRLRNIFSGFESLGSLYLYRSRQIDVGIKQKETLLFMRDYYQNHHYKEKIQPNLFFDMFMYLPGSLMYKGDMASMAYGIENRVPFLDKDFFNTISQIDPGFRLSNNWTSKKIMKKAMEQYLPKDLIYRKKTGFGLNINKYKRLVLEDLFLAIEFHKKWKKELGIIDSGLELIIKKDMASIILKKYPRFAFSLISNYKVMSRYAFKYSV